MRFPDRLGADIALFRSFVDLLLRNGVAVFLCEFHERVQNRHAPLRHLIQFFRLRFPLRHALAVDLRHVRERDASAGAMSPSICSVGMMSCRVHTERQ